MMPFLAWLVTEKDENGVYGTIFHYSLIIALVLSTLLVFIYFWKKNRLDMDEEPKLTMMEDFE